MAGLKLTTGGPKLKLKVPTDGTPRAVSALSTGTPATPVPQSVVTPGGSKHKLVFKKASSSQPPTPAPTIPPTEDVKPKKTKAGRSTKPSAKLLESKKRVKEESDSDNEGSTIAVQAPPSKKIKLVTHHTQSITHAAGPKTPLVLKAKVKGQKPKRGLGEGYDSEASDREEDPYIEEQFVLRMMPGQDCDYMRAAIAEKKLGLPKNLGGPDIHMKFFHNDGRRAAITIRGNVYAATLVDLPTVIEGMKSWDRRGWWKSADICQMLWVFAAIKKEDEAKTIRLPSIIDQDTFQYPHGLTPPMQFARKRRFRKRISRTAIEKVEAEVERLLALDANSASTRYEMLEPDNGYQGMSHGDSEGTDEFSMDEDAEGEAETPRSENYFNHHSNELPTEPFDEGPDDDMNDIEEMFEAEMAAETPSSAVGPMPSLPVGGDTPTVEQAEEEEDDSDDESLEDDDGEDEHAITEDQGEKARLAHIESIKEDIADIKRQIKENTLRLGTQTNIILRKRVEDSIRKMKAELQLKISSLPEEDRED
ncbi:Transcription initiation factor TFIID 55 kDa subunit [Hyphodiscus hymeniophilus]|uniref:Transcription initiation factor TFIID 55 kDa subunit n=1 Tax=Hyphodiscus hymeniophilus TaxID=353542 RepID=A0A9P6VHT0_9HELO|nr:Transcription initiation factor TFIID 55 kDa subunit [Hyphodiscus hymeniophilus]